MEKVTGKTPGKISGSRAGVPAVRSVVSGRVLPLSGDAGGASGGRAAGRKTVPGLKDFDEQFEKRMQMVERSLR